MQSYGVFVPSVLVRDLVSWGKSQIIEQEFYSGLPVHLHAHACVRVCTLACTHAHTRKIIGIEVQI